jgi:hypothetical protein
MCLEEVSDRNKVMVAPVILVVSAVIIIGLVLLPIAINLLLFAITLPAVAELLSTLNRI